MDDEERFPSVFYILVFGTAFGFLIAEMVNDIYPLEGIIDAYQGLIAGMLAVVAAVLTVSQMRTSDRFQESRHRELVALNLQPDALLIERAAFSGLVLLESVKFSADCLTQLATTQSAEAFARQADEVHNRLSSFRCQTKELIDLQQFKDAKRIFNPDAFQHYIMLTSLTEKFDTVYRRMYEQPFNVEVNLRQKLKKEKPWGERENWMLLVEQIRFNCAGMSKSIKAMRSDYHKADVTFFG